MPRVHTLSYFDSAEVWTLQNLAKSLKRRDRFNFQMPWVNCFLRRSWISTLGLAFFLPRQSSIVVSSLLNLRFFQAGAGSLLCRGRWTLLRDKSGDFAHGGFSSLERIQKVGWIIVEEILSLEGDYPCNGDPLLPFNGCVYPWTQTEE